MWYRLVADAAMVAHFSFLAYLVLGGFVAWRWPRTMWAHLAAALYGLFNVLVGWPCPLTHVETWGRDRAGETTLPGTGFIDHYLADVVYPKEHESLVQLLVAAVVLVSWVGFTIRSPESHSLHAGPRSLTRPPPEVPDLNAGKPSPRPGRLHGP